MIEVALAHPPQAVGMRLLDVRVEGRFGDAARLEPAVQRRKIGPGDVVDAADCGRRESAGKSERRGKGQYTHLPILSEEPMG